MIDFHTHILWDIDDGSRSLEESLAMIRMEMEQGVDRIVLTPHFYADHDGRDYFDRRQRRFDAFLNAAEGRGISGVSFILGSEVCYFSGIGKSQLAEKLCIGNSSRILLEMPFAQWDEGVLDDIISLIEHQNIYPVIAHIERYYPYQKNKSIWREILSLPIVPQINAGALLHKWTVKRRLINWLRDGLEVVMGSDCHNTRNRIPNLAAGRAVIEKTLGTNALAGMDERADKLYAAMNVKSRPRTAPYGYDRDYIGGAI